MGFAGNLRTLSLSEVLQTLARIQATGALRLASPAGGRDVVFDQGAIIGLAFRAGEHDQALLKRLVLFGKLDAQAAAGLSAAGSDIQIAEAVIAKGLVSAEDVAEAQRDQTIDELQSLATWDYADFVFEDAGAGNEHADQLVERFRKRPIKIEMTHVLFESARRSDEWTVLVKRIPDPRVVYSPAADSEFALAEMAKEYPAKAVVPLFDGVRTIDDVLADSIATRYDVYSTLAEMIDRRLVQPLGRDELLRNAEHLAATQDFARAARLYRLLLAGWPDDAGVAARLASCLEHLGDPAEAAASWAQLAIQHLGRDEIDQALASAQRAVELAPDRPDARLALVRCLVRMADTPGAVAQLRALAGTYKGLGQLEDVRGTCLKILELAPNDEEARRELARIFSRGDQASAGEDAVVCVRCGHVNEREAKSCAQCQAPLQLTCLSCGRVVGVSDRLCIFCGADPHAGAPRREPGGIGTTRLFRTDRVSAEAKKGTEHWREKFAALVKEAREHEEAGRLEDALAKWREVARWQTDSSELQARIRDLEFRLNDRFIAEQIEAGHALRKGRRFWRALRSYRRALRSMPADDARREPLRQILAVTARHQRRNTVVYVAAVVVLGALGWLVAQPHLQLRSLRARSDSVHAAVALVQAQGAPAIADADAAVAGFTAAAARIRGRPGEKAKDLAAEVRGELLQAKTAAAKGELEAITAALDHQDVDGAAARLATFSATFGEEESPTRLRALKERVDAERKRRVDADLQVKEAPKRLAKAQEREAAGAPAEALALYRSLVSVPEKTVAAKAKDAVARLEPQETALAGDFAKARELSAKDLRAADAAYAELDARAARWGKADDLAAARADIAARLAAATADYGKLGDKAGIPELTAFLAAHPGAPETEQAAARLATMRQQQESRQLAVTKYRQLMQDQKWPEAWQAAHDLTVAYARVLKPDEVAYPLVIETAPAGAAVMVGGRAVGKTPFVLTYLPTQDEEVTLALDGWKPRAFNVRDMVKDWRLQVALARQARWRGELKKPLTALQPLADGSTIALTAEAIAAFDAGGRLAWSRAFASEETADGHTHLPHLPLLLPDGGFAVGQADRGLTVFDRVGQPLASYDTETEVRGRPAAYANDVFGPQPRLAFAAEALYAGQVGQPPARLPLAAPALAGPVVIAKDLDRVLVIADLRGHLVGIEESTKKAVWDVDLQATECGTLVVAAPDLVVMVLDGSRLAACRLAGDSAALAWTQPLGAAAAGDPVVAGGRVLVAGGKQIARFGLDGAAAPPLALPAAAVAGVAASGDLVAGACQDGSLHLFRGDSLLWSTPLTAPATAITMHGDTVYVGQADGAVSAFSP